MNAGDSNTHFLHERDKFKLILFGYYSTGKTSLFTRFASNSFSPDYSMTTRTPLLMQMSHTPLSSFILITNTRLNCS